MGRASQLTAGQTASTSGRRAVTTLNPSWQREISPSAGIVGTQSRWA
jgi:hypothetical protein